MNSSKTGWFVCCLLSLSALGVYVCVCVCECGRGIMEVAAPGKKLFLDLLVHVLMILYILPDGRGTNNQSVG